MSKTILLPTRRATGSAHYEVEQPNYQQLRSCVKPFEKRYHKPFPVWALCLFVGAMIGILILFLSL